MRVELDGLVFERDGRRILDIPELRFATGATTAIFGPNGSGKSTLLRLLAGLERPSAGVVRLAGDVAAPARAGDHRVAFAFQDAIFLRGTVGENLELGLKLRGIEWRERSARIAEVARECGIAHLLDRDARRLSAGEAQRASLARALALRAPLTLLDEPLAGLDRIGRTHLLDDLPHLLETFAPTTILVTHDREEALRLADELVVLVDGRVHGAGPKREVFDRPPSREAAELLGYSVLDPGDGAPIALGPNALRAGPGARTFTLVVQRVIEMGSHVHVVGRIEGRTGWAGRADLRLPADAARPAVGARVQVSAERWVEVPAGGGAPGARPPGS